MTEESPGGRFPLSREPLVDEYRVFSKPRIKVLCLFEVPVDSGVNSDRDPNELEGKLYTEDFMLELPRVPSRGERVEHPECYDHTNFVVTEVTYKPSEEWSATVRLYPDWMTQLSGSPCL